MSAPDSPVGPLRYFVSHNSEVKGPFDLDMIEAFILSGHYPRGVRICAVGSKEWQSYLPPIPTSPAPASGQSGQSPVVKTAGGTPKSIFIIGGVFALVVLVVVLNGTTSGTSTGSSPTGSATNSYAVPPTYEPRSAATPADVLSSDANGRTYSIPHRDHERLSEQRRVLDQEQAVVDAAQAELNAEGSSLDQERVYLNRTNQFEIYDFNSKVDAFNAKKSQLRRQLTTFNDHVDAYNAELARVGTPIR